VEIGTEQAADVLQISEAELIQKLEGGDVPGAQIDGIWVCDLNQLAKYIQANKPPPPNPGTTVCLSPKDRQEIRDSMPD
jgi:hypothetical protein